MPNGSLDPNLHIETMIVRLEIGLEAIRLLFRPERFVHDVGLALHAVMREVRTAVTRVE